MQHSLPVFSFHEKTVACGRVMEREKGSKTALFTLFLPGCCSHEAIYLFCNTPSFFVIRIRPRRTSRTDSLPERRSG